MIQTFTVPTCPTKTSSNQSISLPKLVQSAQNEAVYFIHLWSSTYLAQGGDLGSLVHWCRADLLVWKWFKLTPSQ